MLKSENMKNNVEDKQFRINRMVSGIVPEIVSCANSPSPILIINAILYGAKYRVMDPEFISALECKLSRSDVQLLGVRIGDCAEAALDYLGVKEYTGTNKFIKGLSETGFMSL